VTCRPLPTRPSHYVGGVLQPLRAFLGTDAGKHLQPAAQQEVAEVGRCICVLHCCAILQVHTIQVSLHHSSLNHKSLNPDAALSVLMSVKSWLRGSACNSEWPIRPKQGSWPDLGLASLQAYCSDMTNTFWPGYWQAGHQDTDRPGARILTGLAQTYNLIYLAGWKMQKFFAPCFLTAARLITDKKLEVNAGIRLNK